MRTTRMSSSEAAWILAIDLASCDARFGADQVDRVLQDPRDHADPPHVEAGRLAATLLTSPPVSVPVRLQKEEGLEIACGCSPGRPYVCEPVVRVIVALAVHPPPRTALAAGDPPPSIAVLMGALPALRREAFEERTLDDRLALWLPPRTFDDELEIDVEPVRTASLAAVEARP